MARRQVRKQLLAIVTALAIGGLGLVVAPTALAIGPDLAVRPAAGIADTPWTPDQRYIEHAYVTLLGRSADTDGMALWTTLLGSGTPRLAVANGLTHSSEHRARLIAASYERYLARGADPTGLANWLALVNGGLTIPETTAGIVTSDEYYARSGASPTAWVAGLYSDVLGRPVDPSGALYWSLKVDSGALTPHDVALGFLLSPEHIDAMIDSWYRQMLGRAADPSGLCTWEDQLESGATYEDVMAYLVASDEFYAASQEQR